MHSLLPNPSTNQNLCELPCLTGEVPRAQNCALLCVQTCLTLVRLISYYQTSVSPQSAARN